MARVRRWATSLRVSEWPLPLFWPLWNVGMGVLALALYFTLGRWWLLAFLSGVLLTLGVRGVYDQAEPKPRPSAPRRKPRQAAPKRRTSSTKRKPDTVRRG
jgi:hypothetical protein